MASCEPGPKKVTVPTLKVLGTLLAEPTRDDWFSLAVSRQTGLGYAAVLQIFYRLESWGWVESRWEDDGHARRNGRPRRRFYRLTPTGAQRAEELLRKTLPGFAWIRSSRP